MKKSNWIIDGDNGSFATLAEAKHHTLFWTEEEKRQYDGIYILHIVNDEIVSVCRMTFKDGSLTFGRLERY